MAINNFLVLESEYGKFIVNRHCSFQAESLVKTGRPHIQSELNNILTIISVLPENCIALDAGANIGLVAIPIARALQSRNGLVHAFEVQRMLFYALCGSVALNDLENLIVHNKALGMTVGTLGLSAVDYAKPQDFGLFSLIDQGMQPATNIDVVTIDSLNLPRLDFLKIDVEGMEIAVLNGARRSIENYNPWVWVEYWKVSIDDIKQQFAGLNYTFYIMDGLNMLCVPHGKLGPLQIRAQQA
jgi:FkbM family methyltransferase